MASHLKEPTEKATLMSEFLGTLILCFTVACVIIGKNSLGCLSIAAALMTSIYAIGPVSGGHFNPAVTTGCLIAAKSNHDGVNLSVSLAVRYWLVQFIAGFFGVLLATMTYASRAGGFVGVDRAGGLQHADDFAGLALKDLTFGVFFSEFFFTALLVFVVLSVATTKDFRGNTNESNNFYFALAIGFTIVVGANAIGPISGCALNPAVSFGLAMGSIIKADVGFGDAFVKCLVYAIAEVLGGCLAFGFFNLARPQFDPNKADFKRRAFSELLGTFYLVLTVAFVGMTGSPVPPLGFAGIASALMVLTYSLRSVSGAHFNPAVSMAAFLIEDRMTPVQTRKEDKFAVHDLAAYVGSQLVGGLLAVCTAAWLQPARPLALVRDFGLRGGMNNTDSDSSASDLGMARGTWGAIVGAEVFFTFLLVFVTLNVSVGNTPNQYYGLAIGFVVIAGGIAVGGLSGGCFNPAISFALDMDATWTKGSAYGYGWIYILCQLVAGALAAAVYLGVRGLDSKDGRKAAAEESELSADDSAAEG